MDRDKGVRRFIVDASGSGTHKTIDAALEAAQKTPERRTQIQLRPHITIKNFSDGGVDEGEV